MRKTVFLSMVSVTLATFLITIPATALERTIYLNGVDISGVRGQTFKDTTVTIDEKGNVHLNAPQYKVEVIDEDDAPSEATRKGASVDAGANPHLSTRYYLATRPSPMGRAQYDLVLKVNGIERKVVAAGSRPVIMEISAWFEKGANTIEVVARKNLDGGRKSVSRDDVLELIVGAGHEDDAVVKIDIVHVSFKCDASQITEMKKQFTVNAI